MINLQGVLSQLEKDYNAKEKEITELSDRLEKLEKESSELSAAIEAIKPLVKERVHGRLFFLASRSRKDGPGHFIELFDDNTTKCSCEGGMFGGKCWAQTWIVGNPRGAYAYQYNVSQLGRTKTDLFDSRVKPLHPSIYLPIGTRNY